MILYKVWPPNRSIEKMKADDGRPSSEMLSYTFNFRLVPADKIGAPDEHQAAETRRVIVEGSGLLLDNARHKYSGITNPADRLLYWFAKKALEMGDNRVTLAFDHPWAEIDLSRVEIPQDPFDLYLVGPVMGFHAR